MPKMQICLALVMVCALFSTAAAQDSTTAKTTLTITANATGDRVRITAPSSIVQMHVEAYASSGEKLFDQEIRGGNVFDWHLQDGQAQRLAPGAYVCVVTAKSVSGKLTQKLGTVTVAEKSASVQAGSLQLSLQQTQAIGPVEADSSWTIAGENEPQTPTVIANDGTDGQMIRGRGALTFRIGNFFSGIDQEQMRLTEEGNLGIGTSTPQSKLDVAGAIRAERFLVAKPSKTGSQAQTDDSAQATIASDTVQPLVAGTGTQNRLTKWMDNAGTLGDSGITETNAGNVGIGTTSPIAKLHLTGGNGTGSPTAGATIALGYSTTGQYPQFITTVHDTTAANNEINFYTGDGTAGGVFPTNAVPGLTVRNGKVGIATRSPGAILDVVGGIYNTGIRIKNSSANGAGVSLANSDTGGKTYDIISTGSSNGPGAGALSIYDETLGYLMTFKSGNVGIGTSAPATPLEVNGLLRSTRTGAPGQYLQLFGGDPSSIRLTAQSTAAEKALLIQNLSGAATPGDSNNMQFQLGTSAAPSTKMIITKDGNVGIGTVSPTAGLRLDVNGDAAITTAGGNHIQFGSPNGETGIALIDLNSQVRADLRFKQTVSGPRLTLTAGAGSGPPDAKNGIVIFDGKVGIGTDLPASKLEVSGDTFAIQADGTEVGVYGGVRGGNGSAGVWGAADNAMGVYGSSTFRAGVRGWSVNGNGLEARSTNGFLVAGFPGESGVPRVFHIDLNGTYVTGSDFAESLPVLGNKASYEAGDVLVMTPQTSGRVEKSRYPYDVRVAGIYSTRPGVLGADKDGATRVDPNEVPVAIVGIVPTKISTENGPVRIGDLLTTSRTPGHAMRCASRVKCAGAIVGKAMEPLTAGKGVIKVLVMLR